MTRVLLPFLFVVAAAGLAGAADHAIPAGQYADLKYKVEKGDKVMLTVSPTPLQQSDGLENGRLIFVGKAGTTYTVRGFIVNFKAERLVPVDDAVTFGGKVLPPGPAPEPEPEPPGPAPGPVTSFHVIVVYESAKTYPTKVTGVINSGDIRAYLDSATTPDEGTKGWRLRDKDLSADNDTPFQKALWADVKPKITTVPCWVIEVNKKADIIPLPASVSEGLATLRKYKGEK